MRTFCLLAIAAVCVGWALGQPKDKEIGWQDAKLLYPIKDNQPKAPKQGSKDDVGHRIINGNVSTYGKHPYICSLQRQQSNQWYFICGAVIYNENTILTAAHCVDGREAKDFRVRCGDFYLNQQDQFEQTKRIERIRMHPRWDYTGSRGFPNDLAVMKVESPLEFNDYVNTLPLAERGTQLPRDCQLAGWGVTETGSISMVLKEVTIRRLPARVCKRTWGSLINTGHICFMDAGQPDSSCNGDSGGPAVCGDYLVGVTSWGVRGCVQGYPSVYTRLARYSKWIKRKAFN
ncbi:chymotrypsin-like serine proteinase [Babylonia areolata]|uniref:chymotrypsin-like serine proteinase n=1 Tax=Babylonia areolata TaxID=304850 RepID=UPI003FD58132